METIPRRSEIRKPSGAKGNSYGQADYGAVEDTVGVDAIVEVTMGRQLDPGDSIWFSVIQSIEFAFSALIVAFELKRKQLSYFDINNFSSLRISLQIVKKVLGDQLRQKLPQVTEAEKYLALKVWGKVRTGARHVEQEEPYRFKRIPAEPDTLDRKVQAEMLKRDIKWP